MNWLVFSYSLPSKFQSSPRVTLWRRLRRIGAISPKTGVHILPTREECIEAFQWLAQEVQQLNGEAIVMYVERFEGLNNEQLIELFRAVRSEDYTEIDAQAEELENEIASKTEENQQIQNTLAKLRKRYAEVICIDFFDTPLATQVASRLARIEQSLQQVKFPSEKLAVCTIADYKDKRWVTRPRPFVDRLACAWLIRQFINPHAVIRYSLHPEPDEVAFDMKEAEFGHWGNLCSFENMLLKFGLDRSSLRVIGDIVHELDLRDGQCDRFEITGVETILRGWLLMGLADPELELRGIALFEGLYATFSREEKS